MATNNDDLLQILTKAEGYDDSMYMLEAATFDSIVPGICSHCHETNDCEPDARENWCEECSTASVQSCLVLAGII